MSLEQKLIEMYVGNSYQLYKEVTTTKLRTLKNFKETQKSVYNNIQKHRLKHNPNISAEFDVDKYYYGAIKCVNEGIKTSYKKHSQLKKSKDTSLTTVNVVILPIKAKCISIGKIIVNNDMKGSAMIKFEYDNKKFNVRVGLNEKLVKL